MKEQVTVPPMVVVQSSTKIEKKADTTSQPVRYTIAGEKEYLRKISTLYGQDYEKMEATIQNESGFNSKSDNGLSVGVSQFILSTWLSNCSKVDDRKDPYKSLDCMGKMWKAGNAYQWDVYCNLFGDDKCATLRGLYKGFLNK